MLDVSPATFEFFFEQDFDFDFASSPKALGDQTGVALPREVQAE